jgi:CBS domain-containing membrane protein
MSKAITRVAEKSRTTRIIRYFIYKELIRTNLLFSFTGSFLGISIIGFLSTLLFDQSDTFFLIGSFGASAVLLYGLPKSPLSRLRNLFGGHLISGIIGVTTAFTFGDYLPIAAALAVSASIAAMQITRTIHPPGGATALIAVIGSSKIKALGYFYLLSPVLAGILVLYLVALLAKPLRKFKL